MFTDSPKLFKMKMAVGLVLLLFVGMTQAVTIPNSEPRDLETSKRQTTGEKNCPTNISITWHMT